MSLFTASLNSGSNGNCYYVGDGNDAVLVDAGLSCRETEKRMRRLGLSFANVRAIFISHEHGDHIRGIDVIARKYKLPVYITANTLRHVRRLDAAFVHPLVPHEVVKVGNLTIKAFPKRHDAIDPHSFTISGNNVTVGVFTDIGMYCDNVINYFKQCHACYLETNYDEAMLETGRYPYHLKNRIRGGHGHLSNRQALQLFIEHRPAFMSHIFLSHLSKDNNDPDLVYDLFTLNAADTSIVVASRYNETDLYHITDKTSFTKQETKALRAVQASLF